MPQELYPKLIALAVAGGIALIIVLCVIADKRSNKKFSEKFLAEHKFKDSYNNKLFVTENNELVLHCPSGSLTGYKVWNLEDIAYIGTVNSLKLGKSFSFFDDQKKALKGDYKTPSKKPLLQYKMTSFPANSESELKEIVVFVMKHNSNIQMI